MSFEISTAVLILLAVAVAMVLANSGLADAYEHFWETQVSLRVGEAHAFELSLREVVNDGLMTIFFFVVALEIKRELVVGELRDRGRPRCRHRRRSAAWSSRRSSTSRFKPARRRRRGLGHPDGHRHRLRGRRRSRCSAARVPAACKIFLLTLAIVDDIGAILVIAVFYTDDLSLRLARRRRASLFVVWFLRRARGARGARLRGPSA